MLLKKKWELNSKIVSRAHRYDLYEEEHKGNYIPMREGILLLSQNITANELTKKITDFCKLDSYQYKKNRNDARYFWNKKFNADYNYQKFINEISN